MTDYLALPAARRALGIVDAPSSKSATNRALVLAAMSADPVEIGRPLESEDTANLARCLAAMGARIERRTDALIIHGPLAGRPGEEVRLDAGDSGTAARFLTALCAATPGRFLLTGSPQLLERPMRELLEALVSIGASVESREREGFLPVAILGAGSGARLVSTRRARVSSCRLCSWPAPPRKAVSRSRPRAKWSPLRTWP